MTDVGDHISLTNFRLPAHVLGKAIVLKIIAGYALVLRRAKSSDLNRLIRVN